MNKVVKPSTNWFQSPLPRPDAKRAVLEGNGFRNAMVAKFETEQMAERAVRAVNAYEPMLAALRTFVEPYAHLTARQLEAAAKREGYGRVSPHEAVSIIAARGAIEQAEGNLCRGETELVHPSELRA